MGADHVIDSAQDPNWGMTVRELTGGVGADLVIETRGPDTIAQSILACALYARIVLLITRSPNHSDVTIPGDVYGRSLASLCRIFVGSRANLEEMIKALSIHRLQPVIDRIFDFDSAREAYSYFQKGDVFGKVVIRGCSG